MFMLNLLIFHSPQRSQCPALSSSQAGCPADIHACIRTGNAYGFHTLPGVRLPEAHCLVKAAANNHGIVRRKADSRYPGSVTGQSVEQSGTFSTP